MSLSPIVLFVYNRPVHTKETVEALAKNILASESDLYIFSDGPKSDKAKESVDQVRAYLKTITGFKSVHITEREENFGLSKSIITGVTDIVNTFGKVIVLEDDLVTSPYFLEYMNTALDLYEDDERVISIHGYIYPMRKTLPTTFFLKGADCFGWGTWKRGWKIFEPDGKKILTQLEERNLIKEFNFNGSCNYSGMLQRQIAGQTDSWAIRWYASAFLAGKLTLYPGMSMLKNIGQDGSGTHAATVNLLGTEVCMNRVVFPTIEVAEDAYAKKCFRQYFESRRMTLLQRVKARSLKAVRQIRQKLGVSKEKAI